MLQLKWPTTGNEQRLVELEVNLINDQLNHAYLFAGPPEVGKLTVAKFFANQILCSHRACGKCDDCRQFRANSHPNLTIVDELWVEGVNEDFAAIAQKSNFNQAHRAKNPKAKTDTIHIEDLREVLARLHVTHDGWQVFVIHNIERMNRETANHFLKTLEEPPPRTIFLLTTSNQPALLSTTVSRCRVLQFSNVHPSAIEKMLARDFPDLNERERTRIVNFSMGKPIRAQRLAADPDIFREFAEYSRELCQIFEKPAFASCLAFAEKATVTSAETQKFLEAFTYFLRSFLLARARKPVVGSRYTTTKLVELLRATDATRRLIRHNVNAKLAVENLLLSV